MSAVACFSSCAFALGRWPGICAAHVLTPAGLGLAMLGPRALQSEEGNMFSFWQQLFAQHAWLKRLFEITLLILAAGVAGSLTRRWLRGWAERFDKKLHLSLVVLLDRIIAPVLALAVVM